MGFRNSFIIGDTNFYRTMVNGKSLKNYRDTLTFFSTLKNKEANIGCQSGADTFVILELVYHLADDNDPAYNDCFLSLIGLSEHVKCQNGRMAIIATPEHQIPKAYFGYDNKSSYETFKTLEEILMVLNDEKHHPKISILKDSFVRMKKHVDTMETQFVSDMMNSVVKRINPNAKDWDPLAENQAAKEKWIAVISDMGFYNMIAEGMLSKYIGIAHLKKKLSKKEKNKLLATYLRDYKIPIKMYIKILKRIVETGCNISKPKNSNWIWDMQVAHALVQDHKMQGRFPVLITNDRFIHQVASEEQLGSRVFTIDQYLTCLGVQTLVSSN